MIAQPKEMSHIVVWISRGFPLLIFLFPLSEAEKCDTIFNSLAR